jgi:uncharacterized DUF497 family protein
MRFEWDEDKNQANIAKHGIDFADAQYVFDDPGHFEVYDEEHSIDEDRWIVYGDIGAVVMVVVTYRVEDTVRIISARELSPAERKAYYG